MPEKDGGLMNDDLFQKTISCPLKFYHIKKNYPGKKPSSLFFRQRNKLHVRDAIATQFPNCRHTSVSVQTALRETETWLRDDVVTICGAVVCYENLLTRIPILVKEGERLTIIQVHGKLRKKTDGGEVWSSVNNRSNARYLLKAAYRLEVVRRRHPEYDTDVHFYFPNKHFKSTEEHLHLFWDSSPDKKEAIRREFTELFSKVKATTAVRSVHRKIPDLIAHRNFGNLSVSEALDKMAAFNGDSPDYVNTERHQGCKYCEFRLPDQKYPKGCWEQFFKAENMRHPERHIFELIGQGNGPESKNGTFYQEEAELTKGFQSFDKMQQYGGPAISILQRRNLQILQAKDEPVPGLWIKQGIKALDSLKYPLHFLDFEAATFALPMKSGSRPYNPVYFQFSCHTLHEDGELVHTEWLDQQGGPVHPHEEFVNRLGKVPGIYEGTIMQYSPFEKQGINRLIGDFNRDPVQYEDQIQILEKIRTTELPGYENRFFDVSKVIRDYYFNKFLQDSLGLKQVLSGILQWEQPSKLFDIPKMTIDDSMIDIIGLMKEDGIPDPYKNIQNPDFLITDGSAAMNAWLAQKNGLLTNEEKFHIPKILRKYCSLDSFALFVIYKHLKRFTGMIEEEDLVKF